MIVMYLLYISPFGGIFDIPLYHVDYATPPLGELEAGLSGVEFFLLLFSSRVKRLPTSITQ
jgi:hypothetical protein